MTPRAAVARYVAGLLMHEPTSGGNAREVVALRDRPAREDGGEKDAIPDPGCGHDERGREDGPSVPLLDCLDLEQEKQDDDLG